MTILTAIFGRVWGWLAAAGALLAFLKYREHAAAEDARDDMERQQAAANAAAASDAVAARERVGSNPDARSELRGRFTRKPDA